MKSCIKTLTFIVFMTLLSGKLFSLTAFSATSNFINQSDRKTHLRWNIPAKKGQLKISKDTRNVILETLDPVYFESLSNQISKLKVNKNYHAKFKIIPAKVVGGLNKIEITLKDNSIELFNFYKKESEQYIVDYWINQDVIKTKKAAVKAEIKVAKLTKRKTQKVKKKAVKKTVASAAGIKNNDKLNYIDPDKLSLKKISNKRRDFRYGTAFIWNYEALIPSLEKDLDLKIKTPTYLYEVKDRTDLDDKKEAHMQLSINFFKDQKWGLMTRSINLYDQKYGRDKNRALNIYMKAVSMIKNTINEKLKPEYLSKVEAEGEIVSAKTPSTKGILAAARNLLLSVVDETTDYDLEKAVLRYLIQNSRDEEDYVSALNHAKKLYVEASSEFDDEMLVFSSRVILHSLAHLRQLDKIKSFLGNKAVIRVLPKQEGIAYIGYVNLVNGKTNQVIADYKANERSLVKPIHSSILFNTAESFFRNAQYKKAIKLYDEFISKYSFKTTSSHARLRIALSYDLLDSDYKKVLKLYEDAINKSSNLKVRYEAKLRYVGYRVLRSRKITEEDKRTIVFLEPALEEKSLVKDELKRSLWLTRLRTMIILEQYNDALAYLATLPLETLKLTDQRVFVADGAEIVLGFIQQLYLKEDYAKAVKAWEVYKSKYEEKVAREPYINFIVADSFLKLGLEKSYKRTVKELENLKGKYTRSFPKWINAQKEISNEDYLVTLKLNDYLLSKDYQGLSKFLETVKSRKNINYNFYNGVVSYHLKKYNDSVTSFEKLLVTPNLSNILSPDQNITLVETYLESLYEAQDGERFRKNASAIINDLRRNKSKRFQEITERAEYLYLESMHSEVQPNYDLLKRKSNEFIKAYKVSDYKNRTLYLNAISKINSNEVKDGKEILQELINGEKVPEYIKGLARTELSSLVLKERTL